ncbi:MAG: hypothetical protein HYR76_08200 [Ignavibacteria bacterium]|nr:hypothetical protein [Ignavibacteria bacterium]
MGRNTKYIEFLKILQEIMDADTPDFAKALDKQYTNVMQYLKGQKEPGKRVVQTAIRHLSEWHVERVFEVETIPDPLTSIPQQPGIYALYDSAGNTLYAGQAKKLRVEIAQTLNRKVNFTIRVGPNLSKKANPKFKEVATRVSAYVVESNRLRHNLEALLLRVFPNHSHNNKRGNFK